MANKTFYIFISSKGKIHWRICNCNLIYYFKYFMSEKKIVSGRQFDLGRQTNKQTKPGICEMGTNISNMYNFFPALFMNNLIKHGILSQIHKTLHKGQIFWKTRV